MSAMPLCGLCLTCPADHTHVCATRMAPSELRVGDHVGGVLGGEPCWTRIIAVEHTDTATYAMREGETAADCYPVGGYVTARRTGLRLARPLPPVAPTWMPWSDRTEPNIAPHCIVCGDIPGVACCEYGRQA